VQPETGVERWIYGYRTRKKKKFKSMFREWTQAHRDCDSDKSEWETKIRRFEADVKLKE
jgi:hypothetical protein